MTMTLKKVKKKSAGSTCECPKNSGAGFCPLCSRIKMVFLVKHGMEMYKKTAADGKLVNPVRYSFYAKNYQTDDYLIDGMIRRYENHPLMKIASNYVHFYAGGNLVRPLDLRKQR